jgi:polyisoprenyl-teichoic acid--peptidoglycan teichoic acid transferase
MSESRDRSVTSPESSNGTRRRGAPRAALLSSLVPGWGQAYAGDGRGAYRFFVIDLILLFSVLLVVARFQLEALKAWVSPDALLAIMTFNVILLLYRAWAVSGAYRVAPDTATGAWGGVEMLAAAVVLVVPHLLVGYVAWTQYDLIDSVFAPSSPVAADTTMPPDTTVAGGPSTTLAPATTTTTRPPRIWDGVERLNIALLGSDMRPDQEELDPTDPRYRGHRTDVMIVVSINPAPPYDVALFSVPRFLSNYRMPEGMGVEMTLDEWDWIGHVWRRAEDVAPEAYPGPGRPGENAVKAALGELFGITIHHYALITVGGFIDVIDALGGVTIDVPRRIVDRNYDTADNHAAATRTTVVIEEGIQHLDGFHALAYSRIRSQSHEFARMQRQRCVIGALIEQTDPVTLLRNFGAVATAVKENVQTDIPQDSLADFVELLPNLSTDNFSTLNIAQNAYEIDAPRSGIRYYDLDQIRADAQFLMRDPTAAREALGLTGLDLTCEESLDP